MLNHVLITKTKRSYVNVLICIYGFVLKLLFYLEESQTVSKVPQVVGAGLQPHISYSEAKSLTTTPSKLHLKVVEISKSWCKRPTYTKNSGKTHIRCDPYTQLKVAEIYTFVLSIHSGPLCSHSGLHAYCRCGTTSALKGGYILQCMTCIIIDLSKVNSIAWTLRKPFWFNISEG